MSRIFNRVMGWAADERWNQSDVARRLGVSPQVVSNWKKRDIPAEWHPRLAQLFGRSVEQLVGNEEGGAMRRWPYPRISETKFRALNGEDAMRVETALLLAGAQLGIDLREQTS